jgi:hypothetical protein
VPYKLGVNHPLSHDAVGHLGHESFDLHSLRPCPDWRHYDQFGQRAMQPGLVRRRHWPQHVPPVLERLHGDRIDFIAFLASPRGYGGGRDALGKAHAHSQLECKLHKISLVPCRELA